MFRFLDFLRSENALAPAGRQLDERRHGGSGMLSQRRRYREKHRLSYSPPFPLSERGPRRADSAAKRLTVLRRLS